MQYESVIWDDSPHSDFRLSLGTFPNRREANQAIKEAKFERPWLKSTILEWISP